ASLARSARINTSTNVAGNNTTIGSKSNIGVGTSSNAIDIESCSEYESDNLSLVDSEVDSEVDYDTKGDGYFRDDDDGTKLAISHFAVLVASEKKKKRPAVYVGNSKQTKQRKNKILKDAAAGSLKISQFFSSTDPGSAVNELSNESEDENKSNNEDMTEQDEISEAIEFVNEIIRVDQLSDAERARYTAVLYFLWLLLNRKKKIEASEAVAEVVSGGPWLAKCIRK
ncbi:20877_t:CDS:1, partial [Gigaspora margarita]